MRVAFYKGNHAGYKGWFDRAIRWWLNGDYSHCELVFCDGMSGSSSVRDGGVRMKKIDFDPEKWDMFEVDGNESIARYWFAYHEGLKYDWLGAFGFITRFSAGSSRKYFCSEAVMAALGYRSPWRFDPCVMMSVLERRLRGGFPPESEGRG